MKLRTREIILTLAAGAVIGLAGCANMPTKTEIGKSLTTVTDSVATGFTRLKTKGPSSRSQASSNTKEIFSKYPSNQAPHTLMKKPVAQGQLTSGHGYRFSPTGLPIPKRHKGIDYAAPTGTPIYAAGNGTIVKHYVSKSYGNYIKIEHENGFATAYAHMDEFVGGLTVGSTVTKGQNIGTVGSTGRSSGPHLHYELIHNGNFIDPLFAYSTEEQAKLN